jgi:hypothetical protein
LPADRPRWTTLNLAALWLAVTVAENQRTGLVRLPAIGEAPVLATLMAETEGGLESEPEVLEAAVVFERVAGASWGAIGATLGRPADWVEQRFAVAEYRFRVDEAFPSRETVPAPLRFPEACHRWLSKALHRRGAEPVDLDVDDATWHEHESAVIALMETILAAGETPDGVDPADAHAALELRRVAQLLAA